MENPYYDASSNEVCDEGFENLHDVAKQREKVLLSDDPV